MPQDKDFSRQYLLARDRAIKGFGPGWERLGREFQENAVARQLLHTVAAQDAAIPGDTIRAMVNALHAQLCEEYQ